jgi:hypothetical protein
MQQFLEVFSELKGKKLWLTGESVSVCLGYVQELMILDSMPELMFHVSDSILLEDMTSETDCL